MCVTRTYVCFCMCVKRTYWRYVTLWNSLVAYHGGAESRTKEGRGGATMKKSNWAVGCVLLLFAGVAAVMFAAHEDATTREQRGDLAVQLAGLDERPGQTCNLAWIKAREGGVAGARTPGIHPPRTLSHGPPRVIECQMITTGGVVVEPLIVEERCSDLDLRCLHLLN